MARGNTYRCVVCGEEYQFCPKCQITRPNYDYERYCGKNHADIFEILSKHGCHLITEKEALEALKNYNLTGLTESIQAHINSLQPKKVEVENKSETSEDVSEKPRKRF